MLVDEDLAEAYGYELKAFNQQVKRNIERFQNDMMNSFVSDDDEKWLMFNAKFSSAEEKKTNGI